MNCRLAGLCWALLLALALLAVVGVEATHITGRWERQSLLALTKQQVAPVTLMRRSLAKKRCPKGQIFDVGGKCLDGYRVKYCQFRGGRFYPSQYTFYGKNFVFSLPSVLDATQPAAGQYAVNGNCAYIVNSSCGIERGFSCASCCYLYPTAQSYINVPCLRDVTKDCNITYSANSANCGMPPPSIINTTLCNTCVLGSG